MVTIRETIHHGTYRNVRVIKLADATPAHLESVWHTCPYAGQGARPNMDTFRMAVESGGSYSFGWVRLGGCGMTWREGIRESIKTTVDPLHPTEHRLTVQHRERFEEQVREKFGRLFGLNQSGTATPVPVHPKS